MDKVLTCADCRSEFVFTEREQEFYAEKGFTEPKRCSSCRAARKAARDNGSDYSSSSDRGYSSAPRGPREMHSAICSNCGREALVPFVPSGSKPVYCSDCFRAR